LADSKIHFFAVWRIADRAVQIHGGYG